VVSTTVKIRDCEFIMCYQSWYNNRCDQAMMRDCWITSSAKAENKAVIEHRGARLTIENLCGVPLVGGPKQRWIDNYGSNLTLKQCRFGGEGGGFTPVYNYARYANQMAGPGILFEDCFISANASHNANCAIYCLEVPNAIALKNCMMGGCAAVILDKKIDLNHYFKNVPPGLLSYSVEGCAGEFIGELPRGLKKPVIITTRPEKRTLSPKETAQAIAKARQEWGEKASQSFMDGSFGGHRQQTEPGQFVELTDWSASGYMDATSQKNSDWLAVQRIGTDFLILYRQSSEGGWPHVTITARIDLDRYPWLAWKQKEGTAPGSFALKVIDLQSGAMHSLYGETFGAVYHYHAHNLKKLLGGGLKEMEIRWYPLGWGMKSPKETDYYWAQPGQYVVMDFFRAEAD